MKKLFTIVGLIIAITIGAFFLVNDKTKQSIIFDILGFERPLYWLFVGDMKRNKDRLIYDEEITIWGYLIKVGSKFMLIQDESLEKIHYLQQPNLVVLIGENNNFSNKNIDNHCVGHYVKASGSLIKLSNKQVLYTLKVVFMHSMEKDFPFACTPTYTNGKLDKHKWDD